MGCVLPPPSATKTAKTVEESCLRRPRPRELTILRHSLRTLSFWVRITSLERNAALTDVCRASNFHAAFCRLRSPSHYSSRGGLLQFIHMNDSYRLMSGVESVRPARVSGNHPLKHGRVGEPQRPIWRISSAQRSSLGSVFAAGSEGRLTTTRATLWSR
jgi:hypothetical protein